MGASASTPTMTTTSSGSNLCRGADCRKIIMAILIGSSRDRGRAAATAGRHHQQDIGDEREFRREKASVIVETVSAAGSNR